MRKLQNIFNPRSIAVIGASNRQGSVGYALMYNLLGNSYSGLVYPVNINGGKIHGKKAYKSINDITSQVDLAVIATPAKIVPDIVRDCGMNRVKGVVIISSGFEEIGKEGKVLSDKIAKIAKKYNIRVIGPNCLGFIIPSLGINATFSNKMAEHGKIAFISQSGALCTSMLDWAEKHSVGFSHFVSIGSMLDVGFSDLIDYFGQDDNTNSILIYMESLKDTEKFLKIAKKVSQKKPIVILKVGRSSDGAKAAKSHTGSLVGDDKVFDAAFKQSGIIRIKRSSELFSLAEILDKQPIPLGNKLAVITNAGGPGVVATDSIIENGAFLANLNKQTYANLNKILPPAWSKSNPIDLLGDADPLRYKQAIDICLKDKNIDGLLVILTPQAMTAPSDVAHNFCHVNSGNKTIVTAWMGGSDIEAGREELSRCGIPAFNVPEDAIRSFAYLSAYKENTRRLGRESAKQSKQNTVAKEKTKKILNSILSSGRKVLTESQSKEILNNYGIPVLPGLRVETAKKAANFMSKVKSPVAMKILSPDIIHKTDVGGVVLNVSNPTEASKAFSQIIKSVKKHKPKAEIDGVYIEKMEKGSLELLIGSKNDEIFGPIVVFGSGGVLVELYEDTNIGFPPLNKVTANDLIKNTKIFKLIKGYRGQKGVKVDIIIDALMKFSNILEDFPIFSEIDINPFSIDATHGYVLDAKMIIDKNIKIL